MNKNVCVQAFPIGLRFVGRGQVVGGARNREQFPGVGAGFGQVTEAFAPVTASVRQHAPAGSHVKRLGAYHGQ